MGSTTHRPSEFAAQEGLHQRGSPDRQRFVILLRPHLKETGKLAAPDSRLMDPNRRPAHCARHIDVDGAPWIIDDRLLALLDDLIERLQKCLGDA